MLCCQGSASLHNHQIYNNIVNNGEAIIEIEVDFLCSGDAVDPCRFKWVWDFRDVTTGDPIDSGGSGVEDYIIPCGTFRPQVPLVGKTLDSLDPTHTYRSSINVLSDLDCDGVLEGPVEILIDDVEEATGL